MVEPELILGDSLEYLKGLRDESVQLVVTSPPYNLRKEYEPARALGDYLGWLRPFISGIARVLAPRGSLCWQVGNYVEKGAVFPLDAETLPLLRACGLTLRNRIVWRFNHGLHARTRFSGRYETLLWLTRSDAYTFHLDPVRVPAKYPGKRHFKGPKKGEVSGNPLGANPGDFWDLAGEWEDGVWDFPNVKANHAEKTAHPCQFPLELAERCVLALSDPGDVVLDPFGGVGTTAIAAAKHGRRGVSVEKEPAYRADASIRAAALRAGTLRSRAIGTPISAPSGKVSRRPEEWG